MNLGLHFLGDRDADLWLPLFAICSVTAPDQMPGLQKCAEQLCSTKATDDEDESFSLKLLVDIRDVWPAKQERWDTKTLVKKLKGLEESPWGEQELSPRRLARMLRPFGIEARVMRVSDTLRCRAYEYRQLLSAFNRYIRPESVTGVTNE